MAMNKPTVSAQWLQSAAAQTEADAKESLAAWIILGQTGRYADAMKQASILRRAAEIKSIAQRRDYLRANGIQA